MIKTLSKISGVIAIIIDVIFAIWASIGKPWYFYIISFIALYIVSGTINTSYIQGLTRGYSFFKLYGFKGIYQAIGNNIITVIIFVVSYLLLSKFIFSNTIQLYLYFIIFILLLTIIAFTDDMFSIAIERTKEFENLK